MDDGWEAPAPTRTRIAVIAAVVGFALIVTCVELLRSHERMWEPEDESSWMPPARVSSMSPDTALRTERVAGTLNHFDPAEPSDVLEPAPSRPRSPAEPALSVAKRRGGQRVRTGYLSINSSPWAEISVDGHVVGTTPRVRIRITPGRHHLLLLHEGFQTHSAWIIVPAGGTVRLTGITLEKITP
jgi:hypothetical protein